MKRAVLVSAIGITMLASAASGGVAHPRGSFDVEDKPVREALKSLAREFGADIAVQPRVEGRVTGQFVNCSLEEILQLLLPQVEAGYCVSGSTVIVGETSHLRCQPTATFRMPYVGAPLAPRAILEPEVVGSMPASAQPEKLPYFGERFAGMPLTHFMDPRLPVAPEAGQPR